MTNLKKLIAQKRFLNLIFLDNICEILLKGLTGAQRTILIDIGLAKAESH
jgi:hypothetical protein